MGCEDYNVNGRLDIVRCQRKLLTHQNVVLVWHKPIFQHLPLFSDLAKMSDSDSPYNSDADSGVGKLSTKFHDPTTERVSLSMGKKKKMGVNHLFIVPVGNMLFLQRCIHGIGHCFLCTKETDSFHQDEARSGRGSGSDAESRGRSSPGRSSRGSPAASDDYDSEEDEEYEDRPRKKKKASGFIIDEAGKHRIIRCTTDAVTTSETSCLSSFHLNPG